MSSAKPITCKAAVLYEIGNPLIVEQVTIDAPTDDQVRLKMISAGLCASDAHHVWGEQPLPPTFLPIVMGHEGAAIIESVGPNVSADLQPGDYVLTTFMPQCARCPSCTSGRSNLCSKENGMTVMAKPNKSLAKDGTGVFGYCGLGTYSEYLLVKQSQVVKVDRRVNLKNASPISCGIGCGFYSATGQVHQGAETVAIWGLGTVGLNVAYGCKTRGVKNIIGIETNAEKRAVASHFCVTEFVNPNDLEKKSVDEYLMEKYDGVEYAFECIGAQAILDTALKSLAPFGTLVFIGVAPQETTLSYPAGQLILGRKLVGTLYGNKGAREGITELVGQYIEGKYDVDRLVTHEWPLEAINEAFAALKAGQCVKSIVVFGK